MNARKITIAIQSKGRLREASLEFAKKLGLEFSLENSRMLLMDCINAEIQFISVRHNDIPQYVQNGVADFGIVGENVLYEKPSHVNVIKKLDFGQCSLILAVPRNSAIKSIEDLQSERIATSYPTTLKKFLKLKKIDASIIEISGSVEVTTQLGLADAICDITQTGKTLAENGLIPIEKILDSQAVLIKSPFISKAKEERFNSFLRNANENILS